MTESTTDEIWKPIEGWPYEVSNLGRVRRSTGAPGTRAGRVKTLHKTKYYYSVGLSRRQHEETMLVHVLVCTAFHGPKPSPKHMVAHWDGNGFNNHFRNLRWATMKENCADRKRHGNESIGEKNGQAKLTSKQVLEIYRLAIRRIMPQWKIAEEYGIHQVYVSQIKRGLRWKHIIAPSQPTSATPVEHNSESEPRLPGM